MKVLPFKIPKPGKEALVYQEDHELKFYDKLHEHEEIQISYIAKGSGSLLLGDTKAIYWSLANTFRTFLEAIILLPTNR